MSAAAPVPAGPPGVLAISFDNIGEAAEIELGARPADAPLGDHFTATRAVPAILESLARRDLAASFFVEGLNTEAYPELLGEIDAAGHEIGFHAWRHEQWGELSGAEQAANLARGLDAFERLGIAVSGMRPPGGELGPGGLEVLRAAGLRYCSPAGEPKARAADGIALLPFQWRHVDAACVLPGLGPPRQPAEFLAFLEDELRDLGRDGGFLAIVLHPFMLDWLGEERLGTLLEAIAGARDRDELRVGRCDQIAARLLSGP